MNPPDVFVNDLVIVRKAPVHNCICPLPSAGVVDACTLASRFALARVLIICVILAGLARQCLHRLIFQVTGSSMNVVVVAQNHLCSSAIINVDYCCSRGDGHAVFDGTFPIIIISTEQTTTDS